VTPGGSRGGALHRPLRATVRLSQLSDNEGSRAPILTGRPRVAEPASGCGARRPDPATSGQRRLPAAFHTVAILPTGVLDVEPGQAVVTAPGEWVGYSTPGPEGAEYIAVCLPAFSPNTVHRDG